MARPIARAPRVSIAPRKVVSGLSNTAGPSRVPRISSAFHVAEAAPYPSTGKRRESGLGIVQERYKVNKITDQDIDDRVRL